jgi:hypothetical protein
MLPSLNVCLHRALARVESMDRQVAGDDHHPLSRTNGPFLSSVTLDGDMPVDHVVYGVGSLEAGVEELAGAPERSRRARRSPEPLALGRLPPRVAADPRRPRFP